MYHDLKIKSSDNVRQNHFLFTYSLEVDNLIVNTMCVHGIMLR